MQGKYSPTVDSAYRADPSWHDKILSEDGIYDLDGYDSYGYNKAGRDRAGYEEYDYPAMDAGDFAWIATCWGLESGKPSLLNNSTIEEKISTPVVPSLRIVQQVSECTWAGYVYRFWQDSTGVTVSRVPEDQPYWHHGVIKEIYCQVYSKFVPTIKASQAQKFSSVAEALQKIGLTE